MVSHVLRLCIKNWKLLSVLRKGPRKYKIKIWSPNLGPLAGKGCGCSQVNCATQSANMKFKFSMIDFHPFHFGTHILDIVTVLWHCVSMNHIFRDSLFHEDKRFSNLVPIFGNVKLEYFMKFRKMNPCKISSLQFDFYLQCRFSYTNIWW